MALNITLGTRSAWAFWLLVVVALLSPSDLGWSELSGPSIRLLHLCGTLGIVGLFIAFSASAQRLTPVRLFMVAVLLILFFIRMLFYGLVFFSGRGFSHEFFIHFELQAVIVAWEQYRLLFILLALGMAGLLSVFICFLRRIRTPMPGSALLIGIVSLGAVVASHNALPEWRLAAATWKWVKPYELQIPDDRIALWRKSPMVNLSVPDRVALEVDPAVPPKNLILLYIESGGLSLTQSLRHPDLMPNLRRMTDQHGFVEHLHASSHITIEGIVNSMCGTLLPFEREGESMAGSDGLVEELPCLGDVLRVAGYQQSFLGGADKRFAGKGVFLTTHGYDKVMGIEDWMQQNLSQPEGMWGLSDADLFEQSFTELERLRSSGKPFNLTLLTIGMHLPGFVYKECQPYGDGKERFLNAVSCTDQLVGRWIDRLEAEGWLDPNTILVITGDHQIFPTPEMKNLFGEENVGDRRLPFIVVGANDATALRKHGAGYDIAPTVLDLLGVQGNQQFTLGRSLLREDDRLDYFVRRYSDVFNEDVIIPVESGFCGPQSNYQVPGMQPLMACERLELFVLLIDQARKFSQRPLQLDCEVTQRIEIEVPEDAEAPLKFILSGVEQSHRFIESSRAVNADKPGLFVMLLDAHGRLQTRTFIQPGHAAKATLPMSNSDEPRIMAVAWRPGASDIRLPSWLVDDATLADGGAVVFTVREGTVTLAVSPVGIGEPMILGADDCHSLMKY